MCRLAWLNRLSPSFILAVRLAEAPPRMCPIFENSSGAQGAAARAWLAERKPGDMKL
jgi:hypothetical protein